MYLDDKSNNALVLSYVNRLGPLVLKAYAEAGFELGPGDPQAPFIQDAETRADIYVWGYVLGASMRLGDDAAELRNASDRERADFAFAVLATLTPRLFGLDVTGDVLRQCTNSASMRDPTFADGSAAGYADAAAGKNDELWKHMMRRRMDINRRG
jgi:hypothetical protein